MLSGALLALIFVTHIDLEKKGLPGYGRTSISAGTIFIQQENGDFCGVVKTSHNLLEVEICGTLILSETEEPSVRKIGDKIELRVKPTTIRRWSLAEQ